MQIFFTEKLYKENVFLIGLILNSVCSAISLVLIILCGIQYKYININWTNLNFFHNLKDLELSSSIINIICCILGFCVFIKKLECKTLQKIYILVASLISVYSIIVCIISFSAIPKIIEKNSENSCHSSNMKGILKNINKIENIFYDLDEYICSNDCPCNENEIMNLQKCGNNDILKNSISNISDKKIISNFNSDKFLSYWSSLEDKFDCVGLCNTSYFQKDQNNLTNINKYLFSENKNPIKNYGCIYPLSEFLYNMIISFSSLLLIYIIISVMCIYICIGIFLDKVYEGSNFPHKSKGLYEKGYIGKNIKREVNVIQGSKRQDSVNAKINNKDNT